MRGTNSFSLNGAPISLTGQWQVAPNMEAIQEFKVMVNTYATWYRRRGLREIVTASPAGQTVTEDASAQVDDRDAVWRALLTLAPRQRAVIVLRYYEDMTEMEIATVMGTSPGTVKSQSARALRRLAGILAVAHPAGQRNTGART